MRDLECGRLPPRARPRERRARRTARRPLSWVRRRRLGPRCPPGASSSFWFRADRARVWLAEGQSKKAGLVSSCFCAFSLFAFHVLCRMKEWSFDSQFVQAHKLPSHFVRCVSPSAPRRRQRVLGTEGCPTFDTTRPTTSHACDFSPPSDDQVRFFMTARGCVGWMANTVRVDVEHAHSRRSQHVSKPCAGACGFRAASARTPTCVSRARLDEDVDAEPSTPRADVQLDPVWSFHADSDHATDPEPQDERWSQHGARP